MDLKCLMFLELICVCVSGEYEVEFIEFRWILVGWAGSEFLETPFVHYVEHSVVFSCILN